MLPSTPDLKALRELVVSPYLRSQIQADTVGTVRIKINTKLAGFEQHGVSL